MGHTAGTRPGAVLGYVEDPRHAEYVDHPHQGTFPGVFGRAARWPGQAASQPRRQRTAVA